MNLNVVTEESNEPFVFIYPKRLVLIHSKSCDFCNKTYKENTYLNPMIHLFGYQHCDKCRDICQKHISLYSNHNHNFPTIHFCDHFNIKYSQLFKVKRTSGCIEDNWLISIEEFIKFRNGKYLIPLLSGNIFKYVNLFTFCELNKSRNYNNIITYFSDY